MPKKVDRIFLALEIDPVPEHISPSYDVYQQLQETVNLYAVWPYSPLNVYTGQNPRQPVVLIEILPNAYN